MGSSFPKTRRLRQASQFEYVFACPQKIGGSGITVLARRNDFHHPRLGLVISKRSIRMAVDRNRVKRLAREAFRHLQDRLGSADFIVISRSGVSERDNPFILKLISQYLISAADRCGKS